MYNPFTHVKYRVVVLNGHVGIGIRNGLINWIRNNVSRRINIILAVECNNKAELRSALGSSWDIYPIKNQLEAHNYICVKNRRKRFDDVIFDERDISFGSKYIRAMRAVQLWDKYARRSINLNPFHPDPLAEGIVHGHPAAVERHCNQVAGSVIWFDQVSRKGDVDLAGGDANEFMRPEVWNNYSEYYKAKSIIGQFSEVGMKPAHRMTTRQSGDIRLMELFVNQDKYVRVIRRNSIVTPIEGMDHEIVYVEIEVEKGPKN